MKVTENLPLTKAVLEHLRELYGLDTPRDSIHLSTLVYCLTKSYYEFTDPLPATDNEVLLFSIGIGLERVLTPTGEHAPIFKKDGTTYSPDFIYKPALEQVLGELKTTRMTMKSIAEKGFPDTWIEYMRGGCYIMDKTYYDLAILMLFGPSLVSYRFDFDAGEIEEQWRIVTARKAVLEMAFEVKEPPAAKIWCKDWECRYCRYRVRCDQGKIQLS